MGKLEILERDVTALADEEFQRFSRWFDHLRQARARSDDDLERLIKEIEVARKGRSPSTAEDIGEWRREGRRT
jgi:putative component of toxin-antitoxin plasmid stabilization module